MTDWRPGDYTKDPFASHQPETIECPVTSFRLESGQLEVETDLCNYAFIEFPLLQDISPDQVATLLILHTGLWSAVPAQAHVALAINGTVFWEAEPEIPASAEFFFHEAPLNIEAKVGDPVQLHVHNHGANDWRLGYFTLVEPEIR